MVAAATGAFGLFAGALLLPRYFQTVRDVSATHSGLLIYPLLLGLVVAVNVGAVVIVRRLEFRRDAARRAGLRRARRGSASRRSTRRRPTGSARVHGAARPRDRADLLGPADRDERIVAPARIGAAMGTLMLLRQIGASIAFTVAASLYAGRPARAAQAAAATGDAVFFVALAARPSRPRPCSRCRAARAGSRRAPAVPAGRSGARPPRKWTARRGPP